MKNAFGNKAVLVSLVSAVLFVLGGVAMADVSGALLPQSDGTDRVWTPKSGPAHFAMVDEAVCNGTTDYVYTQSLGASDSYVYSLASVPDGATVTGFEITPCASANKSGNTPSKLNVFYVWNGEFGSNYGSYFLTGTTPTDLAPTTLGGLSFVKSSWSSLQVGIVYDAGSAGNKGLRVSRLLVRVIYTPLAAPSNLTAQPASQGNVIDLTWTDNSLNEDGFKIERSNDGGTYWNIATVGANVVAYSDGGVGIAPGHTYTYRVRAFNSGGNSPYSNTASTTTP